MSAGVAFALAIVLFTAGILFLIAGLIDIEDGNKIKKLKKELKEQKELAVYFAEAARDLIDELEHTKSKSADYQLDLLIMTDKYENIYSEYERLVHKCNALIDKLNSGGSNLGLNGSDIDRLIRLCHPDKHGGSSAANEMTQKLLSMRK